MTEGLEHNEEYIVSSRQYGLCETVFGLKLSAVGVNALSQNFPQIFDGVEVRGNRWPLNNIDFKAL